MTIPRNKRMIASDAFLRSQGYRIIRFDNDLIIGGCDIALQRVETFISTRND